jgi:hypothetical protein
MELLKGYLDIQKKRRAKRWMIDAREDGILPGAEATIVLDGKVIGKVQSVNMSVVRPNRNNRVYPREVLEDVMQEGFIGRPNTPETREEIANAVASFTRSATREISGSATLGYVNLDAIRRLLGITPEIQDDENGDV